MADIPESAQRTAVPLDGDPVIEAYLKDVDRTLLRENLKLTVDQRFEKFEQVLAYAQELQQAGRRSRQEKGQELSFVNRST